MNAYIVTIEEVHKQHIKVFADSEEEAINRVEDGEGEEDGAPEYSYTLDKDTWQAEEIGKQCNICKGTGELKDAVEAWDEPDAPIPRCHICGGSGIEFKSEYESEETNDTRSM